jgi:hypothetical protein
MDKDLLYKILYDMHPNISKWKIENVDDEIVSNFYCDVYTIWKRKQAWERGEMISMNKGIGHIDIKHYPKTMSTSAKLICQLFKIPYYY